MRTPQSSTTTLGLLVLLLIFVALAALIVVFSQQILVSLASADARANLVLYLVVIAFPLILLGLIAYQVVHLLRERTAHKPGSRLKSRLMLFFAVVSLLASIPQAALAVTFIHSSINFWLEARIGEALRGGLSVSLQYYRSMAETLRGFNTSPLLDYALQDLNRNPERLWKSLQTINTQVHFIQVFSDDGAELLFRGNRAGRLSEPGSFDPVNGDLPREDRAGESILRNAAVHEVGGRVLTVVVGLVLAEGFDEKARYLTESLETFGQLERYKRLFRLVLIVFYFFFSLPIFLLSILVSFLLTEEIIRPIVNLEEATRRVAEGDFSFRVLTRSTDEMSVLAGSFNRMVAELAHSRDRLRQTEKISAWQDIAQRLAHEIRNPLTPIKLAAERLLKRYTGEAALEGPKAPGGTGPQSPQSAQDYRRILQSSVASIVREVDNLNHLLVEFSEFARLPLPNIESVLLRPLIEEVAAMYEGLAGAISLDWSAVPPSIALMADRGQITQVLANLTKNAIQAVTGRGQIVFRAAYVNKEGRLHCRIWIKDTGAGIAEEIRGRIFDPYFTTKKDGTGLGLAIVERIVFDHDGAIWFETQDGAGTTFIMDLPAPAEAAAAGAAGRAAAHAAARAPASRGEKSP